MSREELEDQHNSIKSIEAFAETVKKWWPVGALICVLIGAGASVTTAYFRYDNSNKQTYFTKSDAALLSDKIDKLTSAIIILSTQNKDNHLRDSLNAIEIKQTVINNKHETDRQLLEIKKQVDKWNDKWTFVTGKWNKERTKETFSPAD